MTLAEIKAFLDANATEVITIFIEDYVHAPKGITKLFTNAGLMKYWMPVTAMASNGKPWPTLAEMIQQNYRLLVFTQDSSKETTEGVAWQWRYTTENQCKFPNPQMTSTHFHKRRSTFSFEGLRICTNSLFAQSEVKFAESIGLRIDMRSGNQQEFQTKP